MNPQIAAELIQYAKDKQFTPTTWDDLPTRLMAVMAEVGELRKAIAAEQVEQQRDESADIANYLTAMLQDLGFNWKTAPSSYACKKVRTNSSPSEIVEPLRKGLEDVWEMWRRNQRDAAFALMHRTIAQLKHVRRALGLFGDLELDMRNKLAKSIDRAPLHGGKNPRS